VSPPVSNTHIEPPPENDEMDDDVQVGYLLSRREVFSVVGGVAAAAFLAACTPTGSTATSTATGSTSATATSGAAATATSAASAATTADATTAATAAASALPSCIAVPALTEGPYFVEELLNRSDIRSDPSTGIIKDGARLAIRFAVSELNGTNCSAFPGAVIDVWHCDATGAYSDVSGQGSSTKGQKFLRGYQTTDASGVANFLTIYPGWYSGRAVHIHFKIRTSPGATSGLEFNSQLFFDDSLSDTVFGAEPYSAKGQRNMLNSQDNIYSQSQGQTLLNVQSTSDGYAATFSLGVQVS
jgi:protocatechuate 3,4-dioxygenase beta subunit